ncbi:TetR/AcrR family transcriptional regulator [Streptomyces antibioticus]|uniref:TetR/AcrR family transcriptional regulator n=1 Tax=Streptomyces antibioticus TaxID=1890 RepID=UPI00371B07EF
MARMPSAERRRQLTEAAIRAMARDGVARTTTRSIAAEAEVSLSVFHYCFDSKQALIESVITTLTDHSVTVVKDALRPTGAPAPTDTPAPTGAPAPGATLEETVAAGFRAYWDHVRAHPDEHMLTYELTQYALRQPGFEHLARRQYALYAEAYADLIEQLRRDMDLRLQVPVSVLARYLAAMTDGLTLNYLVLGDEEAWTDILETVTAHIAGLVRAG